MNRRLSFRAETFPLNRVFRISRGERRAAEVVTVSIETDGAIGRGEATPNVRYGESVESVLAALERVQPEIEAGLDRGALQTHLPADTTRNALDCALWDLEAKSTGRSIWNLTGRTRPKTILTAYTISLAAPADMAAEAVVSAGFPLLKLKLGGGDDLGRIAAVRAARADARLIADANEAIAPEDLQALINGAHALGVEMIEQPLPAANDAALADIDRKLPIGADEACRTTDDLARLTGRYDMVNIKLDKTGGLTEALRLEAAAVEVGLDVMVGCMVSTSLGLAPAQVVAANADLVDLDAGLYFTAERQPVIPYDGAAMAPALPALWG